jgi:hypothetical protein
MMPYWTQGVVTFHASTANTISINPHHDYAVTHDKDKFTVFVEKSSDDILARIFRTTHFFPIVADLRDVLVQAAFNKTLLRIGIDIYGHNRVSDVIVPARSEPS